MKNKNASLKIKEEILLFPLIHDCDCIQYKELSFEIINNLLLLGRFTSTNFLVLFNHVKNIF